MSLHSPVALVAGVRVPKLKVRNRAAGSGDEPGVFHSASPSTATYRTVSSGSDTASPSILHSPHSQSPGSPSSPVSPARIPKIAVRNRPAEDDSQPGAFRFPPPSTDEDAQWSQEDVDAIEPMPSPTAASPDRPYLPSAGGPVSASHELTVRKPASADAGATGGWPHTPAKKKGGISGVFGYFSVKEPSAAALDQYSKSQRKQAEMKGTRSTALGLPGVTDRKLPAEVPKVNSKWDGLPDWAREAVKEAKKNEKGKSDAVLDKMADHRRPHSQHDSVSTFGSRDSRSAGSRTVQRNSKSSQRPEATRTSSKSSSVHKLRNPSRGRGVPRQKSDGVPQSRQKEPGGSLPIVSTPDPADPSTGASYFPGWGGTGGPPPEAPDGDVRHASHAHKRTMSDPRLNSGMDNVAAVTAFLSDEDVSAGKIVPKSASTATDLPTQSTLASSEATPPIPRKSSKRQSSRSNFNVTAIHPRLERIPTSDSVESWQTAEQTPSLSAFPSPPASPKAVDSRRPKSGHRPTVRAIFPPETPTLAATVLSSQAEAASPTLPLSPERAPQTENTLGHTSHLHALTTPTESPPPTASQRVRGLSGTPHLASRELSKQHDFGNQRVRTDLGKLSPVKQYDVAPWELQGDEPGVGPASMARDSREPPVKDSKKGRWSMLGRKSGK